MRLIDADKLDVERIDCFYGSECRLKDVQEWLDEQPTVSPYKWISVTDRLPTESDGTVLVCMPNVWPYNHLEPFKNAKHNCRVGVAHYSEFSNDWIYAMGGKNSEHRPTHWMPLPEPPEGA